MKNSVIRHSRLPCYPFFVSSNLDLGSTTIFVQQNNMKPHPKANDSDLICKGDKDGFCIRIRMVCQPSNNLDLDVLDLG